MGVIIRQGLKSTAVNYVGAIIGALAVLYIYPLNDEIYGYAQWLYSTTLLLLPFATAGILSLTVKYFPSFSRTDKINYNGFLSLILSGLLICYGVFLLFWWLFKAQFIRLLEWLQIPNAQVILENEVYLLVLLGLMILLRFSISHSTNKLRIVVPDIIEKLGFKLFLPSLVLAFVYVGFSKEIFSWALIGFFALSTLLMFLYLWKIGAWKFGKIKKPTEADSYAEMSKYALYGSLNQIGQSLAFRLDSIMIPLFLSMVKNGYYSKVAFIANILDFPTRSINQIAAPIISSAWEENDYDEIGKIYKEASKNLFLLGGCVFLLIWFGLHDVIALSADPTSFPNAKWIFLALGLTKLIDMMTSVNTQILVYSPAYKYNLIFLICLGILNIFLNIKLIPMHGIIGAAIATAISMFLFNFFKLVFIYWKYKLHPFSISNLKTLGLILILFSAFSFFPQLGHPLVNLALKSSLIASTYIAIAYFWRISEQANELGLKFLNKLIR